MSDDIKTSNEANYTINPEKRKVLKYFLISLFILIIIILAIWGINKLNESSKTLYP